MICILPWAMVLSGQFRAISFCFCALVLSVLASASIPWLDCSESAGFDPTWDRWHVVVTEVGRLWREDYDTYRRQQEEYDVMLINILARLPGFISFFDDGGSDEALSRFMHRLERSILEPEAHAGECFGGMLTAVLVKGYLDCNVVPSEEDGNDYVGSRLRRKVFWDYVSMVGQHFGHRMLFDVFAAFSRWTWLSAVQIKRYGKVEATDEEWNLLPDLIFRSAPVRPLVDVHLHAMVAAYSDDHWVVLTTLEQLQADICVLSSALGCLFNDLLLVKKVVGPAARYRVLIAKDVSFSTNGQIDGSGIGRVMVNSGTTAEGLQQLQDDEAAFCELLDCPNMQISDVWNRVHYEIERRWSMGETPLLTDELWRLAPAIRADFSPCDIVVSSNFLAAETVLLAEAYAEAALIHIGTDSIMHHDTGPAETKLLTQLIAELFFRDGSRGRMLMTSEKLQLQTFYQIGHLPRCSLHVAEGMRQIAGLWRPNSLDVLIFARAYMDTRTSFIGKLLRDCLQPGSKPGIEKGLKATWGKFVFADSTRIRYESWASFYAVVFFPWHLHMITFMQFYAVAVPMFLPGQTLMHAVEANLHFFRQDKDLHFPGNHGFDSLSTYTGLPSMPSPFWRRQEGPDVDQFGFWWEMSIAYKRAGVRFFESCAELVSLLVSSDRQVQSLEMRKAYAGYVESSRQTMAAAVAEVVGNTLDRRAPPKAS